MLFRLIKKTFALAFIAFFITSCSDDDDDIEYLFDREPTDISVLRSCEDENDTSSCYRIRYRYPIENENLSHIYVWLDTTVVDDTSKSVSSKQLEKASINLEYKKGTKSLYDTLDLTTLVKDYVDLYDSLQVAIFCDYSDGDDPGAVQRVFLHFGDDIAPARISVYDSVWTTGAMFEWFRPTDQRDFYKPTELSGPIAGYNVVIYSPDKTEDLRNISIKLLSAEGIDLTGKTLYKRHARIRANNDSIWVDNVPHGDNTKNYLRIAVLDGKGFDFESDSLNRFRLIIDGLKVESQYTIGISAWDSVGNSSGNEGTSTVESNQLFKTTDSIAPLMPKKIFTIEDSLYPGLARLDSNNRLRLFWSRSYDPLYTNTPISVDSVLTLPDTCLWKICYDTVGTYLIDTYNKTTQKWDVYFDEKESGRYQKKYAKAGTSFKVSSTGTFVTDTIRWVSPNDTLIIRIRSVDKSGYYSTALIDTVVVSPGALAKKIQCPKGFLPVKTSGDTIICMERMEHQNESGEFMYNVLHSEAKAACEAISASGFNVSLCKERDWELACLSGGTNYYGVIEEETVNATEYLFSFCNVSTNDSITASDVSKRDSRCVNTYGIRDFPGQYQEWTIGRSEDSIAVVKGASYKIYNGLDRESISLCTNRAFPYYTRLEYTKQNVYLYREGTKVDTVFAQDTSRTLYKVLKQKDFTDTLQFFNVQDSSGKSIGIDYALYSEYKQGGKKWLESISKGLVYVPDHIEVVFLTGNTTPYRLASSFYKSPVIGFRCCAYPE